MMATSPGETVYGKARRLKEDANAFYVAKSYSNSAGIYTRIIIDYEEGCEPGFIRTVYSNRAACRIELGQYDEAISDIRRVLQMTPPEVGADCIAQKSHYRLARCLYEIGRLADALQALDVYQHIMDKNVPSEAESTLRSKILRAIVDRDENPSNPFPREEHTTSTPSLKRAFLYEVKVHDSIAAGYTISYHYDVPTILCTPNPPEVPTRLFLVQLVKKYHEDVMNRKAWVCWKCSAPAVSLVHTPASYLHMEQPIVVDYAQPVCQNGGICDRAAREMMKNEMRLVAELGKRAR